jgi:hypothetical protein
MYFNVLPLMKISGMRQNLSPSCAQEQARNSNTSSRSNSSSNADGTEEGWLRTSLLCKQGCLAGAGGALVQLAAMAELLARPKMLLPSHKLCSCRCSGVKALQLLHTLIDCSSMPWWQLHTLVRLHCTCMRAAP